MKTHWKKILANSLLVVGMALLLSSCGSGGGSTGATAQTPAVTAEVAAAAGGLPIGVLTAPTTTLVTGADGGLVVTAESASLQGLAQGEVVFLPAAPDQGLPFPFVGIVVSTVTAAGLTEIKLAPANVEDAYAALDWDIDTARTGASVVGVIAPKNANVSFSSRPAPVNQAGLVISDKLTLDGNTLSGSISLEHELDYQGKKIVLFAAVDLSKVTVRSKGSYDVKNIASANGWAEFTAVVMGDVGTTIGLRASDLVEIPTLADLLSSQNIWDKLKWSGSDQFKLEGLAGSDKKGRFPLGGVVLTPCPTGVCPVTFKGNPPNALIRAVSLAPTVVLWVYMDMNGNISFSGETGVRLGGHHFEQGYEFKAVGTSLKNTPINVATPQAVEIYGNGKLESNQRLGISVAADILVGGIRPAAVNAFVGGKYEGTLDGELAYAIKPADGWRGNGCWKAKAWSGVQLDANFRLKAQLPVDLAFTQFRLGSVVELELTGKPVDFFDQDLGSACLVKSKLNDTGITASQCYAAGSDTLVSCASAAAIALNPAQDGMTGRDADPATNTDADGKLGFSYTKLGSNGQPLAIQNETYSESGSEVAGTHWSCVRDNVTGLIWEGKTASGLRSGNNTYTNFGDGRAGDASAYAATVNGLALCGFTDWRLPTADELQGLVDYGVAFPGPTIDVNFFPNMGGAGNPSAIAWSSSPYAGNSNGAWNVVFVNGFVFSGLRDDGFTVRLVRASQ